MQEHEDTWLKQRLRCSYRELMPGALLSLIFRELLLKSFPAKLSWTLLLKDDARLLDG